MASTEDRLKKLEDAMRKALAVTSALQGQPSNATLAIAHNDSWLFEDNVDGAHPANLHYVIASTTQRIVSARLSIHLAAYRTYNTLTLTATGGESVGHTHASAAHAHTIPIGSASGSGTMTWAGPGFGIFDVGAVGAGNSAPINSTTPGATGGQSANHTHTVSGSATLGVTEGATATGVAIAFDGVDATATLGGPFNADVIELDVSPFLVTTKGVWHVIAMQPSGLGRVEAHLRLGMYVSAGSIN